MVITKTPFRMSFLAEEQIIPDSMKNMVEALFQQRLINIAM